MQVIPMLIALLHPDVPSGPLLSVFTDKPTEAELSVAKRASLCKRGDNLPGQAFLVYALRMEKELGVPKELTGISLAAACHESGFNADATGDYRDGVYMASGIFQMWPWWTEAYRIDRRNVYTATWAWLAHVKEQVIKVQTYCGPLPEDLTWVRAQVRAVRTSPSICILRKMKEAGALRNLDKPLHPAKAIKIASWVLSRGDVMECHRCGQESEHYKKLREWQKTLASVLFRRVAYSD